MKGIDVVTTAAAADGLHCCKMQLPPLMPRGATRRADAACSGLAGGLAMEAQMRSDRQPACCGLPIAMDEAGKGHFWKHQLALK